MKLKREGIKNRNKRILNYYVQGQILSFLKKSLYILIIIVVFLVVH